MRVWVVDPSNYTPYYDYSLCKALRETGCEVRLITSDFLYDEIPNQDLPVSYLFFRGFQLSLLDRAPFVRAPGLRRVLKALEYPLDLFSLVQKAKTLKPDIVHFQWVVLPSLDHLLFRRLKKLGSKLVYTVHELLPYKAKPWHYSQYAALYATADQIIVPSHSGKAELLQCFALDPAKVHVIPLGNLDDFGGQAIDKEKAKASLGIAPEQCTVLFFGRLRPTKGVEYLLRAFPLVKARIPEAKLLIAGNPGEGLSAFQRLVADSGSGADVFLRLGFVPQDEVATLFSAADVVVLPYTWAYHSALLVTAYTFGRPVVTTAVGGLPEDVDEGRSGYVVPPKDAEKLAAAICAVLADEGRRSEMGQWARHLAETKHAWPNIARATLEVYRAACTGISSPV